MVCAGGIRKRRNEIHSDKLASTNKTYKRTHRQRRTVVSHVQVQHPLASMLLLALLLAVGLPLGETNVSISERQGARLRCHVCEEENGFRCTAPAECQDRERHCTIAAVRFYPRFYYVSKQCSQYCSIIVVPAQDSKNFLIEKPMPFLYGMCCNSALCNEHGPNMNATVFRDFVGRAEDRRGSHPWLAFVLVLASAVLGLSLL
ncbi:lymphocyte antigen 6K [Tamandua tetradactyla]|uniref:lymphocyte antigen 6K n=1 Tax=Tamandua tetradactyla TaxID=48850 RepID=UPI004053B608